MVALLREWSAGVLRTSQAVKGKVEGKGDSKDGRLEGSLSRASIGESVAPVAVSEGAGGGEEAESAGEEDEGEHALGGERGEERGDVEKEDDSSAGKVEEVRRLLKALHAILEGLSTSKID